MKISRECISCLARQAVEIAEEATNNVTMQEEIIKRALRELGEIDFNEAAPEIAFRMHQHAKNITGVNDPYKRLKEQYNEIAKEIYERIIEEKWLDKAEDRFDMACRLAIAGNIIDFSVGLKLEPSDIVKSVEDSIKHDIFGTGTIALREAVEMSKNIMYIADNSGEIIFDKFLLENLPTSKVTYVVKGGPIVNDATMEDAISTGVTDLVRVIDNGHSAQGTILKDCSSTFKSEFNKADLIISKGQANFETLSDIKDKNIFYLLRAKCSSVASAIGCKPMDYVLTSYQNKFLN
ncbi:ARMT1-like domain-containing protein [Proteiniborus sp. MB09-C3]|uniref:damage-control phosphatase ARMT1 family protein n=1 Tax=Proteiniborus sp. MB09-C3 TaxID=3050072 RepID=UPI002553328F|nr:ARMT1-like domain-containing protein [Proteiniborus sp. MB09-C3]WIV12482.1 ARMT1-like domain-containing protein [Proteiniborus sp. MB09-C3]